MQQQQQTQSNRFIVKADLTTTHLYLVEEAATGMIYQAGMTPKEATEYAAWLNRNTNPRSTSSTTNLALPKS